ncbi:hypothetical protein FJT64_022691 [Amphibalanus amphitrite]|uniref:Endonuclease/exonuclease/phosphatase domain-containing protein n=1 Tax=Amphibalanus amphitrite TaxID=1232801 RepID=A0A6A4WEF1_AMPAM|nr:hypothetical protein FJT64_022691 [Amphibalanus amphitrite]
MQNHLSSIRVENPAIDLPLGLPGHVWFRRDRDGRGGGVACAVRASLSPVHRPDLEPDCEVLAVQIGATCPAIIAVCYRPPDVDADVDRICDFLAVLRTAGLPFLLVGDLNLPEIAWRRDEEPVILRRTARAIRCRNFATPSLPEEMSQGNETCRI